MGIAVAEDEIVGIWPGWDVAIRLSPLAEIVYPENQIVVKYNFSGLDTLGACQH